MIEHAVELSKALDAEDYNGAARHLAQGCTHKFRGSVIKGAEAIIATYRTAGEQARDRFDAIRYESLVSPIGTTGARIDYIDIITLAGDTHSYRCAQELVLDKDGLVSQIRHIDLECELEALQRFEQKHAESQSGKSYR